MNSYIASFIILILVFSLTLIAGNSQTAGFTFEGEQQRVPPAFDTDAKDTDDISFGGSAPRSTPQADYDRFNPDQNRGFLGFTRDIFAGSDNTVRAADSGGFTRDIGTVSYSTSRQEPSGPKPETFIINGPDRTQDYILDEAAFKFGGIVAGEEITRFETRLLGTNNYLENWRFASQEEIIYRLDIKGTHTLTFQVRAKTQDGRTDPTPASWTFKVVHSQYWGDIKINSVRPGFGTVQGENIIISNQTRTKIDITNWSVADLTSRARIGQAVDVVQPRANLNFNSNILLSPHGTATIYTQSAPFGISYRENICTTYLTRNAFIDGNTAYETCYFNERTKSGFLNDRWNIYLGISSSIWDSQTTFFLLDQSGAVVDVHEF